MALPTLNSLNIFEKLMSHKGALILIAIITYTECYLILAISRDTSLLTINYEWLKENYNHYELIKYLSAFGLTSGLVFPFILFICNKINESFIHKHNKEESNRRKSPNYINKYLFRRWAILSSNLAAYKCHENFEHEQREASFIRFLCQSILLFSLIIIALSTHSWVGIFFDLTDKLPLLFLIFTRLLAGALITYFLVKALSTDGSNSDYIPLANHKINSDTIPKTAVNIDDLTPD